jgi:hypothetical protein
MLLSSLKEAQKQLLQQKTEEEKRTQQKLKVRSLNWVAITASFQKKSTDVFN